LRYLHRRGAENAEATQREEQWSGGAVKEKRRREEASLFLSLRCLSVLCASAVKEI